MKTVRIQRKRKSDLKMMINWMDFIILGIKWALRPYIDQEKAVMQQAQLEVKRTQAAVNHARMHQVYSRLGIQDEQLRQLQLKNELLENQARMLGLRSGNKDWICQHCGRENTGMVTACTSCGAKK
jgi:hypothetical protein